MRRSPLAVLVLILGNLAAGCAPAPYLVREGPDFSGPVGGTWAVAAPLALHQVPGATEDAFVDGYYVGHLHFSGGFIVLETARGMQNRSKDIQPSEQAEYLRTASSAVTDSVETTLRARQLTAAPVTLAAGLVKAPERVLVRGSVNERDLHDNQNLPHFTLRPAALDAAALPAEVRAHPFLVMPLIVHYYSHNGGWFIGQTYGSPSGARFRVLVTVYDTTTGRPVHWVDAEAHRLLGRVYSASRTQLEDALLFVERQLGEAIGAKLLR